MVDVARVTAPQQLHRRPSPRGGPAEFAHCNLKGKSRCRSAAGAAGRHMIDNQSCGSCGILKPVEGKQDEAPQWANQLNAPEH